MVKVKAHSGEILNDWADIIAKTAAHSTSRLNINYLRIPGLNLEVACNNLTLEAFSRKCIKTLYDARHFSLLLQLHRNANLKILTDHYHLNWSATSFMLNYNRTPKDNASISFT